MTSLQEEVTVMVSALDHKTVLIRSKVNLIVDRGVSRALLTEEAWKELEPHKEERDPKLIQVMRMEESREMKNRKKRKIVI